MTLHNNKELFRDAILATAEYLGVRDIYIEKDYWVTVALYEIFHSDVDQLSVFKGGTSLSKCYKLIERFSEDIDIVVLRKEGDTDNQLKKRIRKISKVVEQVIPEMEIKGVTNKLGNIRKTVHQYDKVFEGGFGQIREQIILEATWLGNFEPYSKMEISSYIYGMMKAKEQDEIITEYRMTPFSIQVLSKFRTFCEKIMSLVRFSRSNEPIADLRNKIRHIYDIHQMLKDEEIKDFFNSSRFDEMLIKVGQDDMIGYKNNNDWIQEHPVTAIIFKNPKETWGQLSSEYKGPFKDLVTGDFPAEDALVKTLKSLKDRIGKIRWEIE